MVVVVVTNLDRDLGNADWTKRTWDLWIDSELVTTAEQLLRLLRRGREESDVELIIAFMKLPAARAAPRQVVEGMMKIIQTELGVNP